MSKFEVEKNVEIPEPYRTGRHLKYPWPDMEPGDSFAVPLDGEDPAKVSRRLSGSGRKWFERHRPDCTVSVRTVGDEIRVWMVEKE